MKPRRLFLIGILIATVNVTTAQGQQTSSPQFYRFSVPQAVEFGMKNSTQVKNALVDISIQEQTNRELTAAAYPQLRGNISANYSPKIAVQSFPNFIAAGTYGVLQQEGVKNGSGAPIVPPTDFGYVQAQ